MLPSCASIAALDVLPAVEEKARLVVTGDRLAHTDSSSCVYFVKKTHGKLTADALDDDVEVGVLIDNDPLTAMEAMLSHIFIPVLAESGSLGVDGATLDDVLGSSAANGLDASLLACLNKFLGQVRQTRQHLTGNVQLVVPAVDLRGLDGKDEDVLMVLEGAMNDWTTRLQVRGAGLEGPGE